LEPAFEPSALCFPLHHGGGGVCITGGQLTLRDAEVRGNHSDDHGGGVLIGLSGSLTSISTNFHENSSLRSGGAFSNFGTATVSNASISGNAAPAGGGVRNTGEVPGVNGLLAIENATIEDNQGSIGGGIDNGFGGHLTVNGSTIAGNDAVTGGGIYNSGGIPDLQADAAAITLRDTVVRGNSAVFGAGLYNAGNDTPGVATVGGVTVADNASSRFGGGMYNAGNLDLTASTLSGNSAVLSGGGLFNAGTDVIPAGYKAWAALINNTISANNGGQTGGGIRNGGDLTATNVTIARNAAETGGNFWRSGSDSSNFQNTILADAQSGANCSADLPPFSLGHNLDSDGTCLLTGPGDLAAVDPLLEPFADNGGPTQTHALRRAEVHASNFDELIILGSPAIDAGDNALCPATDQRREPRPVEGNRDGIPVCDIGAYERQEGPIIIFPPAASPTPSPVPPVILPRTGAGAGATGAMWPAFAAVGALAISVTILRILARR
jgi:hypothetical protein